MKTPEEWVKEWFNPNRANPHKDQGDFLPTIIKDIQKDALSGPMARTTDEQEMSFLRNAFKESEEEIKRITYNCEVYKERWHETRKHLRKANKGAERNAIALQLSARICHDLRKCLAEQRKQNETTH